MRERPIDEDVAVAIWILVVLFAVMLCACSPSVRKRELAAYVKGYSDYRYESRKDMVDVTEPQDPGWHGGAVDLVIPAWGTCTSSIPPICSYYDSTGRQIK